MYSLNTGITEQKKYLSSGYGCLDKLINSGETAYFLVVCDEGCSHARDSVATSIIVLCHWSIISQQVYLPCCHGDLTVWKQSGFKC